MTRRLFGTILFLNLTLLVCDASAKGKRKVRSKKHHSAVAKSKTSRDVKGVQAGGTKSTDHAAENMKAAVARTLKEKNFHLPDSAKGKKK